LKIKYLNSITKLKITGLNFDKFFLIMNLNNIQLFDIKRVAYNELILSINQFDYVKFINLVKPLNYKIENFGIKNLYSEVDKDADGIDDFTDILEGAREFVLEKPKYKSKYY